MHALPFNPLPHRLLTLLGVLAIVLLLALAAAPQLGSLDLGRDAAPITAAPAVETATPLPRLSAEPRVAAPLAPPAPTWLQDPVASPLTAWQP